MSIARQIARKTGPASPGLAGYAKLIAELPDLIPAKQATNRPGRPASGKVRVTMLLDPEIVAKFKATGKGWQARMNDALKAAKP